MGNHLCGCFGEGEMRGPRRAAHSVAVLHFLGLDDLARTKACRSIPELKREVRRSQLQLNLSCTSTRALRTSHTHPLTDNLVLHTHALPFHAAVPDSKYP